MAKFVGLLVISLFFLTAKAETQKIAYTDTSKSSRSNKGQLRDKTFGQLFFPESKHGKLDVPFGQRQTEKKLCDCKNNQTSITVPHLCDCDNISNSSNHSSYSSMKYKISETYFGPAFFVGLLAAFFLLFLFY